VRSDEAWHLLEGGSLSLWLMAPDLGVIERIELRERRRHVVPADWWQAAEPGGDFAYVGATVGPGFDFADFAFGREHAELVHAVSAQGLARLL
jgi:predicted cupin superfamily sugar epimerase